MTRRLRRRIAAGIILSVGALVATAAVRQGGCGREPPDEPVPADCKPGDNTCNAGEPAPAPSPAAGGAA